MDDQDEMIYSPLTCELCSETFTIPAEWVRHIEGHAEATQCVPKKRKRINVSVILCNKTINKLNKSTTTYITHIRSQQRTILRLYDVICAPCFL